MTDLTVNVAVYSSGVSAKPTSYDKATKTEANYRRADVTDEAPHFPRARGYMDHMELPEGAPATEGNRAERCGTCLHYSGLRSCDIVAGIIEAAYVCDWWEDARRP